MLGFIDNAKGEQVRAMPLSTNSQTSPRYRLGNTALNNMSLEYLTCYM